MTTQHLYTDPYAWTTNATTTDWTGSSFQQRYVPAPRLRPPDPLPPRIDFKKVGAGWKKVADRLHARAVDRAMPAIAGGSGEDETQVRVEHKKKVTIERKVGVPRDKGSGLTETHKGTLTLVRTMEGDYLATGTIGIKSEPNGSGYVEVPVEELRKALAELALPSDDPEATTEMPTEGEQHA